MNEKELREKAVSFGFKPEGAPRKDKIGRIYCCGVCNQGEIYLYNVDDISTKEAGTSSNDAYKQVRLHMEQNHPFEYSIMTHRTKPLNSRLENR